MGRPETRRVVEIAWDRHQAGRLARWLLWSTVLTIALTVLLLAAAHLRR